MSVLLKQEFQRACDKPSEITDHLGRKYFDDAKGSVKNSDSALKKYLEADKKRLGSSQEIHQAAYTYLAIGFKLLKDESIKLVVDGKTLKAEQMFHFSGYAFREIGQLNRAADAYWRAGAVGSRGGTPSPLAIRSFARSKSVFAEIGEIDQSDRMHRMEWEARKTLSKGIKLWLIQLWDATSLYGTSASRWFYWLIGFVLFFSVAYEILHAQNLIAQEQSWVTGITGVYYTLVTTSTLGYGEFVPSHVFSQILVILNIILGYVLLGLGLTILGRKTLRR